MNTELIVIGVGLLWFSGILWFVRRLGWVDWAVEARKTLILEANRTGDKQRAKRLAKEIDVFQRRLPVYSRIISIVGLLLLAIALVLYFVQ